MCTETVQRCSETVQLFDNESDHCEVCGSNSPEMSKHKFVLNDETKVNQYGFRVLNAGLDLERFRANPVLLDSHRAWGTEGVIGRWENIQVEGNLLTAEAVFNEADPLAKSIADKVAGGFLRGASLGLNPYSMDNFVSNGAAYDLLKAEVLEASIVSIPNNANAIKLYAATDQGMKEIKDSEVPQILLMANEITNYKSKPMNKIKLTALAAMAIALNADQEHDVDTVNAGILKLKADLDAANQKIAGMEQLDADKKAKLAAEMVDNAIKAGKIEATERETYIQLHAANPDLAKSVIEKLPGKNSLSGQIGNPMNFGEIKSLDDFEKLDLNAQLEFKQTQPEAYKALFS